MAGVRLQLELIIVTRVRVLLLSMYHCICDCDHFTSLYKYLSRNGLFTSSFFIVDASGTYVAWKKPAETDWFYQSFCSAHLEQKHQWGEGIGVEDDLFITNEEWANFELDKEFVGLSAHVLDLESQTLYASGAFTNGGFEKIVEINVSLRM